MSRITLFGIVIMFFTGCGDIRPAPVTQHGASQGPGSTGVHIVNAGDTVWSVAQTYSLPLQDIIIANRLQAPFYLVRGQRLNLPAPQNYRVRPGDTIYSVSRLFGMTTSSLSRMNGLQSPYTLRRGQELRISSIAADMPRPPEKPAARVAAVTRQPLPDPITSSQSVTQTLVPPQPAPAQDTPAVTSKGFIMPVDGPIMIGFGPQPGGLHNDGINIQARRGTPVRASETGEIVYAGNELEGFGNLVLIRHDNGYMSAYAHLDSITAQRGTKITKGRSVGTVGSTGAVDTPQLHFEIRRGTDALNPLNYLNRT